MASKDPESLGGTWENHQRQDSREFVSLAKRQWMLQNDISSIANLCFKSYSISVRCFCVLEASLGN